MGFRNSRTWRFLKGDSAQPSIFDVLYYTGLLRVLRPVTGGMGVIFMAHRIGNPAAALSSMYTPPEFLEECILYARRLGWQIVTLDEMHARLSGETVARDPFACFTFDDGYRDNIEHGLPVFERHQAPFAIYVPVGTPERTINPWWDILDRIVSGYDEIVLQPAGSSEMRLAARTRAEKKKVYRQLWDLAFPDLSSNTDTIERLYRRYSIEPRAVVEQIGVGWDELRTLVQHPLITIGSHTVSHPVLPKLSDREAGEEIEQGVRKLEAELGCKINHFAYPFGFASARDARLVSELGIRTAVLTRKGNVFAEARQHLHTLPRRSFENVTLGHRLIRNFVFGSDNLLDVLRGRTRTIKAAALS
jgi:peptidoglycan/xylan/chitin deacetylase (PgdA/CDA1 family)